MSHEELAPLGADLQALLAVERAAPAMPAELQARLGARIASSVAALPTVEPGVSEVAGSAGEAASVASVASKPLLWIAASFAIGVGSGVVGTVALSDSGQTKNTSVLAVPAIVAAVDAGSTMPPPDARIAGDAAVVEPTVEPPPERVRTALRPASKDKDLAAERALLELSRTAIRRGDAQTALVSLKQHKQRYARGRLSEERDALWVQVLVLLQSYDDAKARAATFRKKYPKSLFAPMVEHVTKDLP